MSQIDAGPDAGPVMPGPVDTTELRRIWGWIMALGAVLLILGFAAIGHVLTASKIIVLVYGVILLVGGVVQLAYAVWARSGSAFFLLLLDGVLSLVLGGLLVAHIGLGAVILTLVLAIYLIVGGILRIVASLAWAMPHRPWQLLSGIIGVALGVFVLLQWPLDVWFIGLYVGVNLIFIGWSLIVLAMVARRSLPKTI